jgi:superfamily II DNA or RNA helicase
MQSCKTPQTGEVVRVRQRRYIVEDVVAGDRSGDSTLVRLACLDDDAQGQALEVLWDHEVDPEILGGEAWREVAARGFDPADRFSAYFHAIRWNCVTATDPKLFQSPFRAGIRIDAYQLEPLRKALLLPRVNLFIADDVGLGKTIEAGLIARELLLRKKVQDIVVACPPSMLDQWQEELEVRFGMTFQILDKDYVRDARRQRGYGVNPWTTHSRFLISHRLLIDEGYSAPMLDWLGDFRAGSLLILDEAHHAAPASGSRYAIDSKITRAVREIAGRFEHRLFLSATPHNGHSNSFSALLEILDPQRFCRGVSVPKKPLEAVMVRRLKEDLRQVAGGFPRRVVRQVDIDGLGPDAPELRLSVLLNEYRERREARLRTESKRNQAAAALLVSGLQQRLLSSIEAFARTLRVHRRTVEKHREQAQAGRAEPVARTPLLDLLGDGLEADDDRASLSEDELHAEEEAQIEAATIASSPAVTELALFAEEKRLLDEMTAIAEPARWLPDARVRRLIDWIRETMCPDLAKDGASSTAGRPARWNEVRVILFTEYEDTKRYIRDQLTAAIAGTDRAESRIEVFSGPTPKDKREEIKRAFNADPKLHSVRILIATDAAREGLNLQAHCHNLFHIDVPWNPSRMEQRNGRIDRKLQPGPEVYCHYFVYLQRIEDRILRALVRKTETIKRELGSLGQVVEKDLARTLGGGIRHGDVEALEREIDRAGLAASTKQVVADELEESRERRDDLDRQLVVLRDLRDKSEKYIGLREDHFRAALSTALGFLGAQALKPLPGAELAATIGRYEFPAIDQRLGADPSWADTLDTLRVPRQRDQKPWEWRRDSPIRPVVFEDVGTMDEGVVHLHLEHRVAQRLLARFVAQGFVHHDLSRACLAQTTDSITRVLLLGRLCLYGPNAARLHEEIVPITARWVAPNLRKGPLTPYAREAEVKTLDLLEAALLPSGKSGVDPVVLERLQQSAASDVAELLPLLEKRGQDVALGAQMLLQTRADKEAEDMREILEAQRRRLTETSKQYSDSQLTFEFDADEQRQLDSNRRHWEKRLKAIDRELATEPARIRSIYEVKAQRIEPVGLVYLWPVSG